MRPLIALSIVVAASACVDAEPELGSTGAPVDFEDFLATVYQEPGTGTYIVDGDLPIRSLEALRAYHASLGTGQALAIQTNLFGDIKWSDTDKLRLTYCVSTAFGTRYGTVVNAMAAAAADWELAAYVDFTHVPAQDGACTASNDAVMFDVSVGDGLPVDGKPAPDARSFFPNEGRSDRSVIIHPTAFTLPGVSLTGVLRHELGHTLGFIHEHYRPEAGQDAVAGCHWGQWFRPVTSYDSASVMHYRQCGGTQVGDLVLTALDRAGAAAIYGGFLGGAMGNSGPGWCGHPGAQLDIGDFDGDGRGDLFCHDGDGRRWIDLADEQGRYLGTDTYPAWGWCGHPGAKLLIGDFNGDRRDDLLCYDREGRRWIDFAAEGGHLHGDTDASPLMNWCNHDGAHLAAGDFDGDGRDDLLCYDDAGRRWIDLAEAGARFAGEDTYPAWGWCAHPGATLAIADVNGDRRDDLICHDTAGRRWIDFAAEGGHLHGDADSLPVFNWCNFPGASLVFADFNGDGRADFLCHDTLGRKWIDFSDGGHFTGENYFRDAQWCGAGTLLAADVNGDRRGDLICRDAAATTWTAASRL
jgi:hypothetical protein